MKHHYPKLKRHYLALLAILFTTACIFPAEVQATIIPGGSFGESVRTPNDSIVIGEDVQTYNIPVHAYYGYSFTQTLYLQPEINIQEKVIERIGYHYAGSTANLDFEIEIWLSHTGLSELTTSIPLTDFTKVYDGTWICNPGENFSWVEIDPFYYNNDDNLIITVIEKKPGWTSPSDAFYATPVEGASPLCVGSWNDSSPYDPMNLPSGSVVSFRANTKLWFNEVPSGPAISEITPTALDFGEVELGIGKILSVKIKNTGADPLEITGFETTNELFQVVNQSFPLVIEMNGSHFVDIQFMPVDNADQNGIVEFLMDAGIAGDREVQVSGKGIFLEPVVIGEGTELSSNTPVYPWYGYSFTQTLYFQDELNMQNKTINRIGYQYGGEAASVDFEIEIWLSHTELTELTETVPVDDFTKVYDGQWVVLQEDDFSWVEIDPFFYNGQDNLIITVIEKKPGYSSSSDKFFATTTSESVCLGAWNDQNPYDPNNLPAGNLISMRANTKLWFSGDIPTEPEAKTTPDSLYFGEVEVSVPIVLTVEVMNVGGGVLDIVGAEITNSNFSLINATFPVSLPIGQKETFEIEFLPTEPGLEEGLLTFLMDESIPGTKTVALSGRALRFGVLREGFENELFPPLGWKVTDNNGDGEGWYRNVNTAPTGQTVPHTGIAAAGLATYAGSPGSISYDDWLITPKMVWQDGDIFKFFIKRLTANQDNQVWRVGLSTTGTDVTDFSIIGEIIDPPANYVEYSYNLADHGLISGDEYYVAIQFNGEWCWPGVVDDVLGSVVIREDYDLMAMDISGPDLVYQNENNEYLVEIGNTGVYHAEAADYTVQICAFVDGLETVFGEVSGIDLASGETGQVGIEVIIPDIDTYDLYGKIVWPADENPANNFTETLPVESISATIVVRDIGEFPINSETNYTSYYPLNFEEYRAQSLHECLYYTNEIETGGLITRLTYYKKFPNPLSQRKIKVYMGQTDLEHFSEEQIPASELEVVFDGALDIEAGIGRLNIDLTTPFLYTGSGNLVVMVFYYQGSGTDENAEFASTNPEYGPERSFFESGWAQIDPNNFTYISKTHNYPNTTLLFETANGLGQIKGTVRYQSDNLPVQDALVEMYHPDFPDAVATLYTDAQGKFDAPYYLAGNGITVKISKYGYSTVTVENIDLADGAVVDLGDSYLIESPVISLSGSVNTSDTQSPAAGATVSLYGMENYETITNDEGYFVFDEIFGLAEYSLEISLEGYQQYAEDITVPGENTELDPITINEIALPPNLVNAEELDQDALITWYAAGEPYPVELRNDDGIVNGVLITPGTPTIFIGNTWHFDATINAVHWYTYDHANYPPANNVLIKILGLTAEGAPDPGNELAVFENVRNDLGWNTYQIPDGISAPEGFFFGIAGYDNYTLVAYDDGVGEPYEWQPRTQWSNGLGNYNPLENATAPPLYGNIFMRADILTTGQIVPEANYVAQMIETIDENLTRIPVSPLNVGDPAGVRYYNTHNTVADRGFEHYNVYRKSIEVPDWELINTSPVTDTSYTDEEYSALSYGLYHYGVEAVYSNGVTSTMAESNIIEKDMRLDVLLIVNNNTGVSGLSEGAQVVFTHENGNINNIYQGTVGADGTLLMEGILKGIYSLEINKSGFETYYEENINFDIPDNYFEKTVELIEKILDPYDLKVITSGQDVGEAKFMWNLPPYFEDAEGYEPFLTEDIDRWTVVDQDGKATVFPAGVTFPHAGEPASFMTFNRTLTTPPLSEVYWGAFSGNQYFASFGSQQGATSNWLISEEQDHTIDYTLSFYAKSITENYGLETFRVGYSTTTNQLSDFIFVTTNETALTYWTKFSYSIPADAKYVAIRHNHTGFALLIDDITLGVIDDNSIPAEGFTVYLDGEEAEAGLMDTEYVFENLVPGTYTAGVQANYYTGSSNIVEKDFTMQQGTPVTFVVEDNSGNLIDGASISIYYEGALVYTDATTGGMANFQLYPGSYAYEVSAEELSTVSGTMEITEDPLEVTVVLNNFYDLQFVVSNSNGDLIDGATVMFDGQTQTTVAGYTIFATAPGEFAYSVTHPDYDQVFSLLNVTADHTEAVTLPEITCEAPVGLSYEKDNNDVTLTWSEPVIGENGTWLHWDGLFDGVSIGTGGPVDFDVAQRFEVEDLQAHQSKFLTRVLFVPSEAACEYSIRVWTGGNIGAPETLVVDQVVENPVIDQWNEIFLETPVYVNGTEELWIGFRSNTTTGHPAGCDIGPAVNGKGNMINLAGTGWQTLLEVNAQLDYNWSVRGLIEEPANPGKFANIAIIAEQPAQHAKHYFLESSQRIVEGFGEPRQLLGYNLYRNSEIQNAALIADTLYLDEGLSAGAYLYEVTAVYSNGCESAASNAVNVMIGSTVYNPPQNLIVEVNMDEVSLQWEAPAAPGEWLHFDNGENFEGIGLNDGGTFRVAARWTPDMLNVYPGSVISSLKLFPRSTADAGFTIKIWKGENAVDLIYEQVLENLSQDAWNTVTLDTPVAIDITEELWVGYEVDHVAGDYPAGTDAGPAIAGFGDMVSLDGVTWEMLSDYDLDYNWNIQVLVSPDNGTKVSEQILPNNPPQQVNKPGTLVAGNLPMAVKPQTSGDFLPDGYHVYRDNQKINGAPVQELNYVDYSVEPGTHFYFVTAVYGQDESEPSNVAEILVQGELGKIQGFVRDAVTNLGVNAATITAVNADNGSLTKITPFGSHYFMMVMPGTYDLTCTAEGYDPATIAGIQVSAGQNTSQTFYLQPQVDILASVHEDADQSLRIYPNPSNGKVYIASEKLKSIIITSIDGQIIHQAAVVADHYTVDHLPGGMYIVKAVTRSGTVFCEKLIVH